MTVYLEALEPRILGQRLMDLRILGPSIVRSVEPPPRELVGRRVEK